MNKCEHTNTDSKYKYEIDTIFNNIIIWDHDTMPDDCILNRDISDWFDIAHCVSDYMSMCVIGWILLVYKVSM